MRALRRPGGRRDRARPGLERGAHRRARRARARVLGQRLASAAHPADGAAPAARGGARERRRARARGASSRPRWRRPTGSRRTIADLLAPRTPARAPASAIAGQPRRGRARSRRRSWRPVFARAGRRLEVATDQERASRARRAERSGQVLDVLLDNALATTAPGRCASRSTRRSRAVLAVADYGAGVAEQDRDRIFERGASRRGGTGIGLHLARALAQADGGALARRAAPRGAASSCASGCWRDGQGTRASSASASFGQASAARRAWSSRSSGIGPLVDDRVAPVVERDPLREAARRTARARCRRSGRRAGARSCRALSRSSGARRASPDGRQRRARPAARGGRRPRPRRLARAAGERSATAPSGRRQAPRPATSPLQRATSSCAPGCGRPGRHRARAARRRRQAVAARPALPGALVGQPAQRLARSRAPGTPTRRGPRSPRPRALAPWAARLWSSSLIHDPIAREPGPVVAADEDGAQRLERRRRPLARTSRERRSAADLVDARRGRPRR